MPSLGEGKALCTETKGSASSDSHVLLTGSFWHLISPSGSHRLDTTARPKSKSHYIFYPFLCQLLPFSQVTVHVSHFICKIQRIEKVQERWVSGNRQTAMGKVSWKGNTPPWRIHIEPKVITKFKSTPHQHLTGHSLRKPKGKYWAWYVLIRIAKTV